MDVLENKNRQLAASIDNLEELNQIEIEKKAILETEVIAGERMKETIQRLKDEKRDLKSELENKEKKEKMKEYQKEIVPNRSKQDRESASQPVNGYVSSPISKHVYSISQSPSSSSIQSVQCRLSKSPSLTPSQLSNSSSTTSSRMSALSIVGDLLKKVGALETKLASCRTFVSDNKLEIEGPNKIRTPLRNNCRSNILNSKSFTPSKKKIDISLESAESKTEPPRRSSRDRTQ